MTDYRRKRKDCTQFEFSKARKTRAKKRRLTSAAKAALVLQFYGTAEAVPLRNFPIAKKT